MASSRWLRFGPPVAVLAVFVALAVASPETLVVAATNPLAWLFIAAVVALSVGIRLVGSRVFHRPTLARGLALVPVIAALAWGFLPAFQTVTVVDAAPVGLPAATTGTGAASSSPEPTSAGPTSADPTAAGTTSAPPSASPEPTTTAADPTPTPVELGSGPLQSLDYRASGLGRLIRLADEELLVRFEGLDVENGPDYVVYLVAGADQRTPGDGVFLGDLQGNQGDQNYAVPAGTAADGAQTILIWCRSFAAPVANASVG